MTGAGTLPSGEEPDGSIGYGSLEDFSLLTGADFIIQLVNQITFAATGYTNLQDALEKIASQIGFPEFAELLLAAFEGITGSLLNFLPWFINLTDLLGFDLNIDPADFNPITVLTGIVERVLELLGLENLLDMLGLGGIGGIFGDLFGLFGGAGNLGEAGNFLENLLGIFNLGGGSGLTQSPTAFDPISAGVSLLDSFIPGIGNILDNMFGGITGLFNSGTSHTDMLGAVEGQTNIVVGNAALLSQVVSALGTGNPDSDNFERTSSTNLGANWDQYQTGSGAKLTTTNGHDAQFDINLLTAGEWVARKNNVQAATDNQASEIVFATVPATFGANGHNDVWLRMTTFSTYATRTGMRFRYTGSGAWSLDWINSGSATNLGTGTASVKATAGATLRFEAGVGAAPRRFRALMNGTPIADVTEVGTTSQVGASYRYRGFGGKSESVLANFLPGKLKQWTAQG